jgi:hypothetical protein
MGSAGRSIGDGRALISLQNSTPTHIGFPACAEVLKDAQPIVYVEVWSVRRLHLRRLLDVDVLEHAGAVRLRARARGTFTFTSTCALPEMSTFACCGSRFTAPPHCPLAALRGTVLCRPIDDLRGRFAYLRLLGPALAFAALGRRRWGQGDLNAPPRRYSSASCACAAGFCVSSIHGASARCRSRLGPRPRAGFGSRTCHP